MRCLCNAHLPSLSPSFSSSSSPPAFLRHGAATTSRRTALAARPASMQHCSTSPRRTHVACRALLDGAGMLDTLITWGAVGASATAVAYALFYTWPCASGGGSHLPGTRTTVSVSSSLQVPEDNFTWAIMGGLSCIPLFNSMVRRVGVVARTQCACMHATNMREWVGWCVSPAIPGSHSSRAHACML